MHRPLVSSLWFLLASALPAWGATYRINAAGTGDFENVQIAIYAMADGDIVELEDGVYTGDENRAIAYEGKAITVRSVSGDPARCIIDCELATRGFLFIASEGRGSVLRGVTIRNGRVSDTGAGILMSGASPTIEGCVIEGCHAQQGGAVAATRGASPLFVGTIILGNVAQEGGGFHLLDDAAPELDGCLLAGNIALRAGGGAVWAGLGSAPSFLRTTISRNVGAQGAGLFIHAYSRAVLDACVLWGNCTGAGAGEDAHVWDTSCHLTITCSIAGAEGIVGRGHQTIGPDVVFGDPLFCADAEPCEYAPIELQSFDVAASSPCLAANNPCGRDLGARGVGCPSSALIGERTWAQVKDAFR